MQHPHPIELHVPVEDLAVREVADAGGQGGGAVRRPGNGMRPKMALPCREGQAVARAAPHSTGSRGVTVT